MAGGGGHPEPGVVAVGGGRQGNGQSYGSSAASSGDVSSAAASSINFDNELITKNTSNSLRISILWFDAMRERERVV